MSRDNLVPKIITDRNGVVTTRLTNPDKGKTAAKNIPPVAPRPKVVDRMELMENIIYMVNNRPINGEKFNESVIDKLHSVNTDVLVTVNEELRVASEERFDEVLFHVSNSSPRNVKGLVRYSSLIESTTTSDHFVNLIINAHMAAKAIPTWDEYDELMGDEQKKVNALLNVSARVYEPLFDVNLATYLDEVVLPEDLRDLISSRHEDADRIADIIVSKGITSAHRVEEMLDSSTPSIAEGVL